jgi:hypothetical protein
MLNLCDVVDNRAKSNTGPCSYYRYKLCLDDILLLV